MTPPVLETSRLLLRTWTPDDAPAAFRFWGDPEVMRHVDDGLPVPDVEEVHCILGRASAAQDRLGYCLWPVIEKSSGELVGCCGFQLYEDGPALELAYHFARRWWGRGYATEAGRACLSHAFEILRAPRVVAAIVPANAASRRVLEKLGFRPVGLDEHGEELFETTGPASE